MKQNQSSAAAKLMASEPREARLALEGAGAGTWEIRPRSGEHVLSWRGRQLLGIGAGEAISIQRLLAALHPADRERWKEAVAEVLDPEKSGECYLEFRAAGPESRWLAASGRAFFEGVCAVRVAGTLWDISEEKTAEPERDLWLGQLGHDLRAPLSAISVGIQLLQRVSLAAICREAIDEAALAHPGHPIEFERWDEAAGDWDRDRLAQVMRNLVSNALDHGAPTEPVIVSCIDCGEEVLLAVANRGPPIPDPFREHLFDATRRGTWSSEHLGLYIVKEIVRAQGGRIELTSDESGTVFHVWLPKIGERS